MKNKIFATLVLTVVLASCSGIKKTTSNNANDNTVVSAEKQNTPKSNTTSQVSETSPTATPPNIATQTNGSTGAMSNFMAKDKVKSTSKEYTEMFTAIEMSEEQISTFNVAMNQFKTRQANMASGEMLGSIESERTRQLESILSSAQFAKYEKWKADNQ